MTKIAKELITKGLTKELIIMYLINEEGIEKNEAKKMLKMFIEPMEIIKILDVVEAKQAKYLSEGRKVQVGVSCENNMYMEKSSELCQHIVCYGISDPKTMHKIKTFNSLTGQFVN